MKIIVTIIKWIWIVGVLCFAGLAATLMGAFAMDAPSASVIGGAIAFILIFCIVALLGLSPIWLSKIGKKDAQSVESRKKLNCAAIGGAIAWALFRFSTSHMNLGGCFLVFAKTFVVLYIVGLISLKLKSKVALRK